MGLYLYATLGIGCQYKFLRKTANVKQWEGPAYAESKASAGRSLKGSDTDTDAVKLLSLIHI